VRQVAVTVLVIVFQIFCLLFFFDDDRLEGISEFATSPTLLFLTTFTILYVVVCSNAWRMVIQLLVKVNKKRMEFYIDVEDRLCFEEFELPNQEFHLEVLDEEMQEINHEVAKKKIQTIN